MQISQRSISGLPPLNKTPYPFPESLKAKYWPIWIGMGCLRLVAALPYPLQTSIGKSLGVLLYYLMRKRRCISQTNLRLVFPEIQDDQLAKLTKRNFRHLGLMLTDNAFSWWASPKRLAGRTTVIGQDNLEDALKAGQGVILLFPHLTAMEIGSIYLCQNYPIHVMYKRSSNALAEAIIHRARSRYTTSQFTHKQTRGLFTALKSGDILFYAPDQDFGAKRSVFADFMGVQSATTPATSRLVEKTGAAVIPCFPIRLPGAAGIEIRLLPPLTPFPGKTLVDDCTLINRSFGKIIAEYPEQYFWLHRRFKTRPEGEPPIYHC